MDWAQVLTIVGSNIVLALMGLGTTITLFLWARSEARHDQQEIRAEMKNFHDRIEELHVKHCTLEERFLNWLTKEKQ